GAVPVCGPRDAHTDWGGPIMNARPIAAKPESETPSGDDPTGVPSVLERTLRPGPSRAGVRVLALGGLALVALVGAVVAGTLPRLREERTVNAQAAAVASRRPRVTVAVAQSADGDSERVLPGNSLPLLDAALFARTTGYVNARHVDIGDRVEK